MSNRGFKELPTVDQEMIEAINEIESNIVSLLNLKRSGIVNGVDAAINDLRKKDFVQKEKAVLKVHQNAISKTFVKGRGEVFQTRCGNMRPRRTTYVDLIEDLYSYYFEDRVVTDYSFKTMFKKALEEKIKTENPKEKTIRDYENTYKAFITPQFETKDIRLLTPSQVKAFLQKVSQEKNPTKKRFYKFKGLLNLVFDYAADPDNGFIRFNPVPDKNGPYEKNFRPVLDGPEDKAFQPEEVKMIREYCWNRTKEIDYDVNAYAILFSSETGVREGEIPSLKWEDIHDTHIHIHSQQNDEIKNGKKTYYYNPATKNEKGVPKGGRKIPMTGEIRKILSEVKAWQERLGIETEWVFAREDGDWITTVAYYEALYKICKKLGLKLSNNHAFRMALNSYVYIPLGLPATERARILGHSVETNLKYYSFARSDNFDEINGQIDAFNQLNRANNYEKTCTPCTSNIVVFKAKEKSPRTLNSRAFSKK